MNQSRNQEMNWIESMCIWEIHENCCFLQQIMACEGGEQHKNLIKNSNMANLFFFFVFSIFFFSVCDETRKTETKASFCCSKSFTWGNKTDFISYYFNFKSNQIFFFDGIFQKCCLSILNARENISNLKILKRISFW